MTDDPRKTRILVVTGDHALPDATKWDGGYSTDDIELHEGMRAALSGLSGYEFEFLTDHAGILDRLRGTRPDLILNFCDTGFRNVATRELHLPAIFEVMDLPYSGAPPAGMVMCYDKALVRVVAASHGIPAPSEVYVEPGASLDGLRFSYPAFVKPVFGDGSVGIDRNAVVHSDRQARAQLAWLRSVLPGRAALVQEYLPGPEYGLALLGNRQTGFTALPPLEVDFGELPAGLPPILAFESKTGPENAYGSVRIRRARLATDQVEELRSRAEFLFERLECRDYARFDFRTGADGEIKLMEVNPNPAWSSAGKLALMAGFAGMTYAGLLETIVETALARVRRAAAEP